MNRWMNETVRIGWRGSRGNRAGSIRGGISRPIGVRALGEITELVRPVVMTEFEDMRDYFTSAYFQGCQERLRTMPDILVGAGADFFSAQAQQRLSSVERLNTRFAVEAQHQSIFRGIQIQPNNIQQLGLKIRIRAEGFGIGRSLPY